MTAALFGSIFITETMNKKRFNGVGDVLVFRYLQMKCPWTMFNLHSYKKLSSKDILLYLD